MTRDLTKYKRKRNAYGNTCGQYPKPWTLEFIGPVEAREAGLEFCYPGIPCENGHIELRYISGGLASQATVGNCMACGRINQKIHNLYSRTFNTKYLSPKYVESAMSESVEKETRLREAYVLKNPTIRGVSPVLSKEGSKRHIDNIRKLLQIVISRAQRSNKLHERDTELGYTAYDLRKHLEKLFSFPETWESKSIEGKDWAVDHIVSVAFLESQGILDPKIVNHLLNLQPLPTHQNGNKHDKVLKSDIIKFREDVLLPNGYELRPGWEFNPRVVEEPFWLKRQAYKNIEEKQYA